MELQRTGFSTGTSSTFSDNNNNSTSSTTSTVQMVGLQSFIAQFKEESFKISMLNTIKEAKSDEIVTISKMIAIAAHTKVSINQPLAKNDQAGLTLFLLNDTEHTDEPVEEEFKKNLTDAFLAVIEEKIKSFNVDEFSTLAIALTDLDSRKEDLFKIFVSTVEQQVKLLSIQFLIRAAFALRKSKPPALFTKLYTAINAFRAKFLSPEEIGYLATAFATFEQKNPTPEMYQLFDILSGQVESKSSSFKASDTSRAVWGFAYIHWFNQQSTKEQKSTASRFTKKILNPLKEAALTNIQDFTGKQTVRIFWSFAKLRFFDEALINGIIEKVQNETNFSLKEIANLIKKFLESEKTQNEAVKKLKEILKKRIEFFKAPQVVTMAGGLLISFCKSKENEDLLLALLKRIFEFNEEMDAGKLEPWKDEELSEINTIYKIISLTLNNPDLKLPSSLDKAIANFLEKFKQTPPESSKFHLEVAKEIQKIKSGFVNEYPFESFFLDMANEKEKIAIEIDGDTHFDTSKNYLAKNQIKERMLELNGWNLIRISHFEWNKAKEKTGIDTLLQEKFNPANPKGEV